LGYYLDSKQGHQQKKDRKILKTNLNNGKTVKNKQIQMNEEDEENQEKKSEKHVRFGKPQAIGE
jgi:hypothetical protein